MELSNLRPAKGSTHSSKRIGRGQGSGKGGTSTRGHKGAKSRSGYSKKVGFEGGQMPLQRRVPKFGFKNINRVEYVPVSLELLQKLSDKLGVTTITIENLIDERIISKRGRAKVLCNGELSAKLDVTAHGFSKAAIEAIEAKGGTATKL